MEYKTKSGHIIADTMLEMLGDAIEKGDYPGESGKIIPDKGVTAETRLLEPGGYLKSRREGDADNGYVSVYNTCR